MAVKHVGNGRRFGDEIGEAYKKSTKGKDLSRDPRKETEKGEPYWTEN